MPLYVTPVGIGYLTQLVLATLISVYFLSRLPHPPRRAHVAWFTGFIVALTGFIVTLFLEASLLPTPRLYAVFLQNAVLGIAVTCLIQFAYHFPTLTGAVRREARLALVAGGLYALGEAGYAVFRFLRLRAGVVEYRPNGSDYVLLLFFLWVPVAFLRKALALTPGEGTPGRRLVGALLHPPNREVRSLRTFALLFLLVAGLNVFNILRAAYLLSVSLANIGISLGILGALFTFTTAYINHQPETVTFTVKLAGVALTMMLAVFSVLGWVVSPIYEAHYRPPLPARQGLRFTPNALDGYDVTMIPLAFERDLGVNLHLDDGRERGCSDPLPFSFPFYGQQHHRVYACNDGVISLGRPARYRDFQYRYGAGTPLIMALLIDLDPTTSAGGIFARQESDRLIITWQALRGFRRPEAEFTFQATLYPDGAFDLAYPTLPEEILFQPNDDPGASLWAIGATPGHLGGALPAVLPLTGPPLQSGPEGVIQDYVLEFRQHLNVLLVPLTWLILASSALIVSGFPLLLTANLVKPLNALLSGVRQLEAGQYTARVPVQYADEIGFLTQAFNTLAGEMGDLIQNLEARVAHRTARLDAVNAQLRTEIAERERAQATIIEQQRTLAAFEERERMGRELHDGLGQTMGYINMESQTAQILLAQNQLPDVQASLERLTRVAQDAHADIRDFILGLREAVSERDDLYAAVRAYLDHFTETSGVTATVSCPPPPAPHLAPTVEEQVLRIIQEALVNVRKHARADEARVTLSLTPNQLHVVVADDGVGFDRAGTPPELGGHFGLSIMRERAARIGGHLEIRSSRGQGTQVLLAVPGTFDDAGAERDDEDALQRLRILLADDHPLFLDGLRNLLLARGMMVVGTAHDGRDAVEKVRALRPDVAVLDLNMPQMNGLEATRAIKAEFPEIKVVILTVSEERETLFEAIKSGASGYLLKNVEANKFCALLAGIVRGEAPLAPGMADLLLAEFARSAAPGEAAPEEVLTPRQLEVLELVAQGLTYKEVGEALHLSEKTIKYHMGNVLGALQVQNRAEAIAYLARHGTRPQ